MCVVTHFRQGLVLASLEQEKAYIFAINEKAVTQYRQRLFIARLVPEMAYIFAINTYIVL